jgi:adenylosuccinate synthase
VNQKCTGVIGSGVVLHIPSFFEELDALQAQGTEFLLYVSSDV